MILNLTIKNGDVIGAFKTYLLARQMALQKWKREFKAQYIALNGTVTIDGVECFGGKVYTGEFSDPDIVKLGELFGLDDEGIAEVAGYNDGDVHMYMDLVPHQIYTRELIYSRFHYDVVPNIPSGQTFTFTYAPPGCYIDSPDGSLPDLPDPISLKQSPGTDPQTLVRTPEQSTYGIANGTGVEHLDRLMLYTYILSDLIDENAASITVTTEFYGSTDDGEGYVTYFWRTVVTIDVGSDLSWLESRGNLFNTLFDAVYLGSSWTDYARYAYDTDIDNPDFWFNYGGLFWYYVNTGSRYDTYIAELMTFIPDGTHASNGLYIGCDYWDGLTTTAAMSLAGQTVYIAGEYSEGGGFWNTFVGIFIRTLIGAVTSIVALVEQVPILNPYIKQITWTLEAAGYGKEARIIEDVYKKLRTAVLAYYASYSDELGTAAGAATAESGTEAAAAEAAKAAGIESLSDLAVIFGPDLVAAGLISASPTLPDTPPSDSTETDEETGELRYEYGEDAELQEDLVEMAYRAMDAPTEMKI